MKKVILSLLLCILCLEVNAESISGLSIMCVGDTPSYTTDASGGPTAWSSSNPTVATIDASGHVTALSAGTTTISFLTSTSTLLTYPKTVVDPPNPGTISGHSTVCVGASISLSSSGDAGGIWYYGAPGILDIDISTGVVTGVAEGIMTVKYQVANSGCDVTVGYLVTVIDVPVTPAAITGTATLCAGTTTTLSDATAGGTWSSITTAVGTIGSATGVLSAVSTGTTLISYTVTNICGTASTTTTVTVNDVPAVSPISGNNTLCVGLNTYLTDPTSSGTWSSSNPSIASVNASTGVVTGISSGTPTISYSVTNSCGTTSVTFSITVNPLPAISCGSVTICNGLSSSLSASGAATYTWSPGIGLSATTGANPTANPTVTTTYSITGTSAYSCLGSTVTVTVTVNPTPAISCSPVTFCYGSSSSLTASGAATYMWSPGTGLSATTGANPTTSATVTTTYSITGTNAYGCMGTGTVVVSVNPLPNAGTISGAASICRNTSITLTSSGFAGGTWSSSSATFATITSSTGILTGAIYSTDNNAHTVTISYTYTNVCGTAVATVSVIIKGRPSIHTNSPCVGFTCQFDASPTDAAGVGAWAFNPAFCNVATISNHSGTLTGVAVGANIAVYTYAYAGSSTVCAETVTANGTIASSPSVVINGPNDVVRGSTISLNVSSGNPLTTTWSSSATSVATVSSAASLSTTVYGILTATIGATTTITVTRNVPYCTVAGTKVITILGPKGVNPNDPDIPEIDNERIRIYPNPSSGKFTIELSKSSVNANITITDINGKILETKITDELTISYDIGKYPKGIYILNIETGERKFSEKIVKE